MNLRSKNSTIDSKIYGIGVNIASAAGKIYVINVIKGAPADVGGIKAGDMILKSMVMTLRAIIFFRQQIILKAA